MTVHKNLNEYQRRKQERRDRHASLHGVKAEPCVACAGSGVYDDAGSPPCGSCGGTGKNRRTNRSN